EIVNLPSASVLAAIRRNDHLKSKAPRPIAVFADPVFEATDHRVHPSGRAVPAARPGQDPSAANSVELALRGTGYWQGVGRWVPRLPKTRNEANDILAMVPER